MLDFFLDLKKIIFFIKKYRAWHAGVGGMKGALKGELAEVKVRWQQSGVLGAVPEYARRGEALQGHKMCKKKTCVHNKRHTFVFILQSDRGYTL